MTNVRENRRSKQT